MAKFHVLSKDFASPYFEACCIFDASSPVVSIEGLIQILKSDTNIDELVWHTRYDVYIELYGKLQAMFPSIVNTFYVSRQCDARIEQLMKEKSIIVQIDSLEDRILNQLGYQDGYVDYAIQLCKNHKNIRIVTCVSHENLYYFAGINDLVRKIGGSKWYIINNEMNKLPEKYKAADLYIRSFIASLSGLQIDTTLIVYLDYTELDLTSRIVVLGDL